MKQERRTVRERELGKKQRAMEPGKYGVIIADHTPDRMAELAAKDCVLFLWVTNPILPEAMAGMKACGFTYKTCCCVLIDGHHGQLVLLGTRGKKAPAPAMGTQYPSVIRSDQFPEMVERYFPTLPRIDIRRQSLP